MVPSKKRKLDDVQQSLSSLVTGLEDELSKKDEALKEAMRLLCANIINDVPRNWKDMPEVLQNDPTALVQAIVSKRKFNYIRREDINEAVLQKALPILIADYREAALCACEKKLLKWEEVNPAPEEWREFAGLSVRALFRGLVQRFEDIPAVSQSFIIGSLKAGSLKWEIISPSMQNDKSFCCLVLDPKMPPEDDPSIRDIPRYYSWRGFSSLATTILRCHPELVQSFDVWDKIIEDKYPYTLVGLFEEGIQPVDANLIDRACRKEASLLERIDQVHYADVVKEMIIQNPSNLGYVFGNFIEAFPEFFIENLAGLRALENTTLVQTLDIPTEMWENEVFAHAWFMEGLPLLPGQPALWKSDRDKLLRIAEHDAGYCFKMFSFDQASTELLNDVAFMTQAMHFEPSLFGHASENLRNENPALAIWALGDVQFLRCCLSAIADSRHIILSLTKIEALADLAYSTVSFVNPILCASHKKQLTIGNVEPVQILKKIGEYLGIPHGGSIEKCRKFILAIETIVREVQQRQASEQELSASQTPGKDE